MRISEKLQRSSAQLFEIAEAKSRFEYLSIGTINIPGTNRLRCFTLGRPTQLPDSSLDVSTGLIGGRTMN